MYGIVPTRVRAILNGFRAESTCAESRRPAKPNTPAVRTSLQGAIHDTRTPRHRSIFPRMARGGGDSGRGQHRE